MKHITKEQVLTAIEGSGGIIENIARRLGINWHTAKILINKYKETKRAYEDEVERVLDLAELAVINKIKEGDTQLIKFYLMTKGKGRGYTYEAQERQEVADNELKIVIK